jgi:hypothetical protein
MKLRNWSNCLIPWILLFVFTGQDCNIQERGHGRFTPNMLWCPLLSTDLFLALHDWRFKPPTFLGLSFSVRASWIGMGPFKNSWTLNPLFRARLLSYGQLGLWNLRMAMAGPSQVYPFLLYSVEFRIEWSVFYGFIPVDDFYLFVF